MTVKEIENEIEFLKKIRFNQIKSIEFWGKKLAETNQNIYNFEIDLIFENAKLTNLKTATDGANK
jgi:hypothetical protein